MISRREFLRSTLILPAGVCVPRIGLSLGRSDRILVCVFQRGAVDGLSMLVPYADPHYYDLRDAIAIPEPGVGQNRSLRLNDQFAFHPALRPLYEMYKDNRLVAIPGCGSPHGTRSHFDAQDYMESGVAGNKGVLDGWMNRALAEIGPGSPFEALAMTTTMPRALRGRQLALNIADIDRYEIGYTNTTGGIRRDADAVRILRRLYSHGGLAESAQYSFEALQSLRRRKYKGTDTVYPDGQFSRQLMQLAQLIKSDLGVKLAFVDIGGWDTHANQGGAVGQLAGNLYQLGYGLDAFFKDLGEKSKQVVVITMSEFGRTVKQNGNNGTDHGHGTTFLAMGAVNGGRVSGNFQSLRRGDLYEGRDVPVTTDYRDVLAEILHHHMGVRNFDRIFPGFEVDRSRYPGVMA